MKIILKTSLKNFYLPLEIIIDFIDELIRSLDDPTEIYNLMHFKNQLKDDSELPTPNSFACFRSIVEIWSINEIWLVRDAKLLTSVLNKRTQIRTRLGFFIKRFFNASIFKD